MSFKTRRSSKFASSFLIRASQDQDFDPFASQSTSSQRRTMTSASHGTPNDRRALAEETNSVTPAMKQSESQVDLSQRRALKRSPSDSFNPSSQSPTRSNIQVTLSTSNATNSTKRLNRDPSSSPTKRSKASPSPSTLLNGSSSPRRNRAASPIESALLDSEEDDEPNDDFVEAAQGTIAPADDAADANGIEPSLRKRRSPDKFLPGAIRRIALSNFLTYDSVEFRVGPYLNLICGPNGTGKSSIACAIALGLGGHPSLLGRASNLGSFVKRGEADGWIEIELQAWPDQTNLVIRRTLTASSNKSDWYVNGRSTTKTDVLAMVSEYNIDVGNLCSFLPQDKVHEFAKMTDAKRLVETEKAVGGAKLVRWHEKLNQHGKAAADIASQLKAKQEEKAHLEQRNQALQVDVQRFEERQEIENHIDKLRVMIAMANYNNVKRNVVALQRERDTKRQELSEAVGRSGPIKERRKDLNDKANKLKVELQRLDHVYASDEKKRRQLISDVESIGRDIEGKLAEVSALKKKDQDRARRMQELRKEIADRSAQLGDEPGVQDTAEIEAQLRRIREKLNDGHNRRGDIQRQMQDVNVESQTIDKGTQSYRNQLAQLDNVPQQRLEKLRGADEHVYKAVMWLRQNQHRFRKPVHEPVLLEISLKDQRYAAAVESCIPFAVQKSFVCQTRADYDLFTSTMDSMKIRVTVAEVEGITLESQKPDVPREQLASLGFDAYIIDLIDGPHDVLVHLCRQAHLNRLPVTLNPNVDVERVERSNRFRRFIAGGENFTINVSQYGNNVRQTVSRRIGQPRSLTNTVDRERQRSLSEQIQRLTAQKKELEAKTLQLLKEDKAIQAELAKCDAQVSDLKGQKRDCVGAQRSWEKESALIENRRRELRDREREPSLEEKRARLMKEIRKLAQRRAQKMQDLVAQTVQMSKVADRKHVASLSKWQWDVTATQLDNAIRDLDEQEREIAATLEEAVHAHSVARREATELRSQVQHLIDERGQNIDLSDVDPDDDEMLNADTLNASLRAEESKLDLAEGVRPEVIDQYRARQRDIASKTIEITELQELATSTEAKIGSIREKWEPTLRRVICAVSKQFSKAFDDMGLAGELRIVQDVDYEKWKLEIMVKFRNAEELAPLSAQHQSGGERTLSTIMYIMSLLQLSRSPFTLVDEINQGMDPTAERVTHNHIVGLTCQMEASQYFLITPKLLPDLAVHELQKVLLVNNGVYGERRFDFGKVHDRKKKVLGMKPGERLMETKRVMEAIWESNSGDGVCVGLFGSQRQARSMSRSVRR
ncbi:related to SMC5 - Structural maintenance of chromosomes, required for cell viability [Melanopsichium pennsylvanicum]|uniref:Structural maintenance of chromosomes protein 5 n=2 Tax=Melanopsichium pennsylvanicum TaxID=63383 RepID=A0AAJ5C6J5_9BASI|nr:related to SMC5-Structural maintenance of chromosomes, required for cell viability [Melanopsichium pennsylvanicum 4]SNX85906.1 related to SMC5 - Structural maintenance of chromosomes, required for cell viability [Melanopsichium pennsylvanicum]